MNKKILILFIALATIIACKKSSKTNSNNTGTSEEPIPVLFDTTTCILNQNQVGLIKEVYPDYMIISGQNLGQNKTSSNISAINIHENGYFVSEPNIKFPQGTYNKIFKITPYGVSDFKAEFFPYDPTNPQISICEALEAGSFKNLLPVTDKVTEAVDENGNPFPIEFDGGKLKLTINKTFDWDGNTLTTDDKVEVSGVLKTNLDLDVNLRVKDWQLEKFSSEAKVKFDGELSVKASLALMEQKKTFKICDYKLKPITILVGGVFPIVINPVVTISAIISEKGEVSIEGTVLKYSGDVSQGFEYTQTNGFKLIGTTNLPPLSSALNPALTASFEGEVKLTPEVLIEYRLYDKDVSVSTGLGLYGKFKATAEASTSDPSIFNLHATLTAGMEGKVKGKLKLFNKNIVDKELAFTIAEITLWDNKTFLQDWINISNSLIAYYPFNGNANDASGNNNNGIINGAILTTDRKGNNNSAYNFDGQDDFISINNSNSLQNINDKITISTWVYANQYSQTNNNQYIPILEKNNTSQGKHQFYMGYEKTNGFLYGSNYGKESTVNCPNITLNQWHHIVMVFNGTSSFYYLNGNKYKTTITNNVNFNSSLPLILGQNPAGLNEILNGKLDDIRIYNRVLSEPEVQLLYSE